MVAGWIRRDEEGNPKTDKNGNLYISLSIDSDELDKYVKYQEEKKAAAAEAKRITLEERQKVIEDRKKAAEEKRLKTIADREAAKKAKEDAKNNKP